MNDNESTSSELEQILNSFCPDNITTLQRLKRVQDLMLYVKSGLSVSLLAPAVYLLGFWDVWSNSGSVAYVLAILCALLLYFPVAGYKAFLCLEQQLGKWKLVKRAKADRILFNVGWVFVPSADGAGKP